MTKLNLLNKLKLYINLIRNKTSSISNKCNNNTEVNVQFSIQNPTQDNTTNQVNTNLMNAEAVVTDSLKLTMKDIEDVDFTQNVMSITNNITETLDAEKSFIDATETIGSVLNKSQLHDSNEIGKLGLHRLSTTGNIQYYSGVIYLPETELILSHYITLYRLKLDLINQTEFIKWCNKFGHYETSKMYSKLCTIYSKLKSNHYKDSFIINKIASKQSVHLRITDRFGNENSKLRAFIIIGKRKSVVQNIIDSYCFDVRGRVPLIIKTEDEFCRFTANPYSTFTQVLSKDWDFLTLSQKQASSKLSKKLKYKHLPSNKSKNILDILDIDRSTIKHDLKIDHFDSIVYDPFSRYMKNNENDDNKDFSTPKIYYDEFGYKLMTIITDNNYAYLLCRKIFKEVANDISNVNVIFNSDEAELANNNQSNVINNVNIDKLKSIVKNEIAEASTNKYYGIDLKQFPCGQLFVVECIVYSLLIEVETLLKQIFMKHMICGKIMSKKYNNKNKQINKFTMHIMGNERRVINCVNELRSLNIAKEFNLKHPRTTQLINEADVKYKL